MLVLSVLCTRVLYTYATTLNGQAKLGFYRHKQTNHSSGHKHQHTLAKQDEH